MRCETRQADLGEPCRRRLSHKNENQSKWSDVDCETKYKVRVKVLDSSQTAFTTKRGADVTQVTTTALDKGKTYFWFVKA